MRLARFVAAVVAALAALVSFGSIGFEGDGATRIGLVYVDWWHVPVALGAGLLVWLAQRRSTAGAALISISPLALVCLAWLPLKVPAVALVWSGPLTTLVWLAVLVPVLLQPMREGLRSFSSVTPRHGVIGAGVLAFVLFSVAAWCTSEFRPSGDEPHYLVITQSLLYDHDLKIENNHRRGDYQAYFLGNLPPDFIRLGRNRAIYSIHAPGLPALVLPAFALAGYRGVVVFLLILSACAAALAWWLAWRVSRSMAAAWFGWAAVCCAPPYLLETYTVYPDGPGAAAVLVGVWALLRADWDREQGRTSWKPWLLYGLALAALPWLHTRFAVLAATLGGLVLIRLARSINSSAKAIAFLTAPALSALAWLAFFTAIYGTADPSAPYGGQVQNSFSYLANGLGGLFLDQGYGLFAAAPVLVVALAGFGRTRRLALDWLVVATPYLLLVTTFAMWWAGSSGPARFFVPLILPLAIPAACAWTAMRSRGVRAIASAALLITCWLSAVMAAGAGGRLGYHSRNEAGVTAAPWVEWAVHVVDLPSALPAFVPLPAATAVGARQAAARTGATAAAVWLMCLGVGATALGAIARTRLRAPETLAATTTLALAIACCAAVALVWRLERIDPLTSAPAQLDLLRHLTNPGAVALDLTRGRRLSIQDLLSRLAIQVPVRSVGQGAPRFNRPLAVLPAIPAGEYRMTLDDRGGEGWVMAGIGNDQFSIVTAPLAAYASGVPLWFPVDARALIVRGDEDARQSVRSIAVRPVRLLTRQEKLSPDVARRAVRYDDVTVFFLDDRAYPEPAAFWVAGARETAIVLANDRRGPSQSLVLRNAPVDNRIALAAGRWREEFPMAAGEERRVEVPVDVARGAVLLRIRTDAGFRPSETDPQSRDARFLGVYVRPAAR